MNIRTKADALALFGGRQGVAQALGIRPHAVSQWPDELRSRLIDELVGAAWRLGLMWRNGEPPPVGESVLSDDGDAYDVLALGECDEWFDPNEGSMLIAPKHWSPIPPLPGAQD